MVRAQPASLQLAALQQWTRGTSRRGFPPCLPMGYSVPAEAERGVGIAAHQSSAITHTGTLNICAQFRTLFPPAHHTGSTDPLIVIKVLEFHGIPKEQAMARMAEVQKVRTGSHGLHGEVQKVRTSCNFGRQRSDVSSIGVPLSARPPPSCTRNALSAMPAAQVMFDKFVTHCHHCPSPCSCLYSHRS